MIIVYGFMRFWHYFSHFTVAKRERKFRAAEREIATILKIPTGNA